MPVHRTFSGPTLRARRKQLRLSRTVVAFAVGRTVDSIANYERGLTTPSAEVLARIAEYLDCSPNDLYEREAVDV
jgi:transcriptional regulator with XRE-family HTH domain